MNGRSIGSPLHLLLLFVGERWKLLILLVAIVLLGLGVTAVQPLVMAPLVNIATEGSNVFAQSDFDPAVTPVTLNNIDKYISYIFHLGELSAWNIVLLLSSVYLALSIVAAGLEFLSYWLKQVIRIYSFRSLEQYVYRHLLGLSLDFFNNQKSGELVTVLQNNTSAAMAGFVDILRTLLVSPLMILFYGYLLVRTDLTLTLLVGLAAMLQWIAVRVMKRFVHKSTLDQFDIMAEANAYLQEVFQNIREVKTFVAERFEQGRLSALIDRLVPINLRFALYKHGIEPIVASINALTNVTMLLLVIRELFTGELTLTGFFLFLYLGRAIVPQVSAISQAYLGFQEMSATIERVYKLLIIQPTVYDGSEPLDGFNESLRFENVSFSYGDETVLKDINFEIKRGQMVALVGPSGAGKSTLTDLLLRFYDPDKGRIEIGGRDIRQLEIIGYRSLFGVVSQENLLFNATVAENIAYGLEIIDLKEVESAAKVANASDFISQLPKRYNTLVGDRGVRLSGGERQRIAIARAVAHKPEILVLDEATSSLDSESEKLVREAIDRVIKNTTALVIAHRLSTVIHADKIVVLDKGVIIDQGTHSELLQRCELYQKLCELQFGASKGVRNLEGEHAK